MTFPKPKRVRAEQLVALRSQASRRLNSSGPSGRDMPTGHDGKKCNAEFRVWPLRDLPFTFSIHAIQIAPDRRRDYRSSHQPSEDRVADHSLLRIGCPTPAKDPAPIQISTWLHPASLNPAGRLTRIDV